MHLKEFSCGKLWKRGRLSFPTFSSLKDTYTFLWSTAHRELTDKMMSFGHEQLARNNCFLFWWGWAMYLMLQVLWPLRRAASCVMTHTGWLMPYAMTSGRHEAPRMTVNGFRGIRRELKIRCKWNMCRKWRPFVSKVNFLTIL